MFVFSFVFLPMIMSVVRTITREEIDKLEMGYTNNNKHQRLKKRGLRELHGGGGGEIEKNATQHDREAALCLGSCALFGVVISYT